MSKRHLKVKVTQSCLTLCDCMDQSMEFSRLEYWSGQPFPSPGDLPNPGIKPRSPAWQADSLPAEPQGKPKNTGVGSLFLPQGIFPTQESNWGVLHCRWILYQLSYERNPTKGIYMNFKFTENKKQKYIILFRNDCLFFCWITELYFCFENSIGAVKM